MAIFADHHFQQDFSLNAPGWGGFRIPGFNSADEHFLGSLFGDKDQPRLGLGQLGLNHPGRRFVMGKIGQE